jgi:hypothetical protein
MLGACACHNLAMAKASPALLSTTPRLGLRVDSLLLLDGQLTLARCSFQLDYSRIRDNPD